MEHVRTRGQPAGLAAVRAMVLGPAPHAVLLVGPPSSGKATLAGDLAAGLLCLDPEPAARPCGQCRGCRQVASGNHPDLHRLAPEGPGGQIRIGKATDPEPGTIRHLVGELALLPVEGGARVAIVEAAHRMNEDAQNALLKTLEEPPAGVTIVLCADDDERLLPTVRSRCVRVRLGTVSVREIETWLGELEVADASRASRLARLAGGRPGLALAYARAPDAERLHGSIARGILDLLGADRRVRLSSARSLLADAAALNAGLTAALAAGSGEAGAVRGPAPKRRRGKDSAAVAAPPAAVGAASVAEPQLGVEVEAAPTPEPAASGAADPAAPTSDAPAARTLAAADRRAAALMLLEIWASVGRDLAMAARGARRELREVDLLDELTASAATVDPSSVAAFLDRLAEVGCQLDENVNPELAVDVLALAWPRPVARGVGTTAGRRPSPSASGTAPAESSARAVRPDR